MFTQSDMLSEESDIFTSSFPTWIPFISFSSLIAMARTSKTMLNKSGKSEHPYLVPDLRGNAFSYMSSFQYKERALHVEMLNGEQCNFALVH